MKKNQKHEPYCGCSNCKRHRDDPHADFWDREKVRILSLVEEQMKEAGADCSAPLPDHRSDQEKMQD